MKKIDLASYKSQFQEYTELRVQENRKNRIVLVNGNIVGNNTSSSSGVSARVNKNGTWGFASHPEVSDEGIQSCIQSATENARFLAEKSGNSGTELPGRSGSSENCFFTEKPKVTQEQKIAFLQSLDTYISKKYPDLTGRTLLIDSLDMEKQLISSDGTTSHYMVPRSLVISVMNISMNGENFEHFDFWGDMGEFEDIFSTPDQLYPKIDQQYKELMDKTDYVEAEAGEHDVILDARLAGILAHEAIGHTTEADIVLGGSIAPEYLNKEAASPLVTLVDFAHTAQDKLCPVPLFIDDEGVVAEDKVIIDKGILKGYMHNRETAACFDVPPTGNARANEFYDEPLVRMRNTAILPGESKLEDMIKSIKKGYYLIMPNNGQADSTSEFMFGVTLGYEIVDGKLGKAIKDITISGVAFDVLKSVSMVSDDMRWDCAGMCGKKQPIPVGMGGPAIKCKVNIGGK